MRGLRVNNGLFLSSCCHMAHHIHTRGSDKPRQSASCGEHTAYKCVRRSVRLRELPSVSWCAPSWRRRSFNPEDQRGALRVRFPIGARSASVPKRVTGSAACSYMCVCVYVYMYYIYRALFSRPLSAPSRSNGNYGEPDARALALQRHHDDAVYSSGLPDWRSFNLSADNAVRSL